MRPSAIAIGLLILAAFPVAFAQQAPDLETVPVVVAVDAQGKLIGNVINLGTDGATVAFQIRNGDPETDLIILKFIWYDRSTSEAGGEWLGANGSLDQIFFERSHCTGEAFIVPYVSPTGRAVAVAGDHVLWVSDPYTPKGPHAVGSTSLPGSAGTVRCESFSTAGTG